MLGIFDGNAIFVLPSEKIGYTVVVAQLVRASVCGSEGRGFESHHPPQKRKPFDLIQKAFLFILFYTNSKSRLPHFW